MPDPRAAYIHVPFCAHRCGYCNFTLVAGRDDLVEPYLQALEIELLRLDRPRPVETLFLGGGTPTYLRGERLTRLLRLVKVWHPLTGTEPRSGEFSVEANPLDLDDETVAILAAEGVTRVSVGGQSFQSEKLRILERDHSGEAIAAAIERLRGKKIAVALDLIFGAPGEKLDGWESDLATAVRLAPDHLSTYGLTFERGTTFWNRQARGELSPAGEELERDMYELAIDRLASEGFEHYEVSNFARPGARCRHNEVYWMGEEYFAAGPGAARYVGGVRELNHRSTTTWLRRLMAGESPVVERETLSPRERARELLVFALRRLEGVKRSWFVLRSGFAVEELVGEPLLDFVERGLLLDDGQTVRLSRAGLLVSDAIWSRFLRAG